ncbi:MAG: HD domain-containing protein, partial [Actinomycetota bacterium]|nr:HD domain-containing protein [Actinomycetota bacterium]
MEQRWRAHPWVGQVISAVVLLGPVAASAGAAVAVAQALPRPGSFGGDAIWWLAVLASSGVVLVLAERALRRLLPLAGLLKMTMLFPDRAPSRMRVAIRAGSTRDLERRFREGPPTGAREPAQVAGEILSLAGAISSHDRATRGHSERVRVLTEMLAEQLGLTADERDRLRWSSLLHDVGKLTVHPAILNKPAAPTAEEWEELRRHPLEGARLTAPLSGWLGEWALAIEQHHEQFDGSGYPFGLSGDEISLGARIVAVADAFEVMTASRSYKDAISPQLARAELARCAGTQFDPEIVRAFFEISLGRLRWTIGLASWLAEAPLAQWLTATGRMAVAGVHVALASAAVVATAVVATPVFQRAAAVAAPAKWSSGATPSTEAARRSHEEARTRLVAARHLGVSRPSVHEVLHLLGPAPFAASHLPAGASPVEGPAASTSAASPVPPSGPVRQQVTRPTVTSSVVVAPATGRSGEAVEGSDPLPAAQAGGHIPSAGALARPLAGHAHHGAAGAAAAATHDPHAPHGPGHIPTAATAPSHGRPASGPGSHGGVPEGSPKGRGGAAPGASGAAPGQTGSTPSRGHAPSGHKPAVPAGHGGSPGKAGAGPGASGSTPSQGSAPGRGSTPGRGSAPGRGSTPGRGGASPSPTPSGPTPSGPTPSDAPSGPAASGPAGTAPGQGGAPGGATTPSGQGGTVSSPGGTSTGPSGSAPGQGGTVPSPAGSSSGSPGSTADSAPGQGGAAAPGSPGQGGSGNPASQGGSGIPASQGGSGIPASQGGSGFP